MDDEQMLRLKAGATLVEGNSGIGLCLDGKKRWVQDAAQDTVLRRLLCCPDTLDRLSENLCDLDGRPLEEAESALALAAFILDFNDYLES